MSSPKNSLSKLSKKPKISVRPVWKKKLNYCNSSNVDDVNTPTPMPKPPSPCNAPLKENSPISTSNLASPQPYSPPIIDPYVDVVLNTEFVSIFPEFSSVREVYRVSDYLLSENSVVRVLQLLPSLEIFSQISLIFVYKDPIFESYEMSTSKTYQQSFADAGSETRPLISA
ncbi:hypothetical protein Tco_1146927 [Tanacetum coccineum]